MLTIQRPVLKSGDTPIHGWDDFQKEHIGWVFLIMRATPFQNHRTLGPHQLTGSLRMACTSSGGNDNVDRNSFLRCFAGLSCCRSPSFAPSSVTCNVIHSTHIHHTHIHTHTHTKNARGNWRYIGDRHVKIRSCKPQPTRCCN